MKSFFKHFRWKLKAIWYILRSKSFLFGTRQGEFLGQHGIVWDDDDLGGLFAAVLDISRRAEALVPDPEPAAIPTVKKIKVKKSPGRPKKIDVKNNSKAKTRAKPSKKTTKKGETKKK
jgi:hypothetical protein